MYITAIYKRARARSHAPTRIHILHSPIHYTRPRARIYTHYFYPRDEIYSYKFISLTDTLESHYYHK